MERTYKRSRRLQNKKDTSEQIFMKNLRRSVISMLLCTVCLISSTWAWFVASAESQLAVIQTKIPTLGTPVSVSDSDDTTTYALRRPIRKNADGEYKLAAGRYTITAEPAVGTAPMYCLIQIRPVEDTEERLEDMIEAFNLDMEQEWIPIFASDSNAIRVLKSDEDLEEFELYIEENMDDEIEFEYEVLSIPVITEGTYRIEWEPGEERVISLELAEDVFVSYEIFWLTEDDYEYDESKYLSLDELNGWNYAILYQKHEASPGNAVKTTAASGVNLSVEGTQAVESTATVETGSVAPEESTAQETAESTEEHTSSEGSTQETLAENAGTESTKEETSEVSEGISASEDRSSSSETNAGSESDDGEIDYSSEGDWVSADKQEETDDITEETDANTKESIVNEVNGENKPDVLIVDSYTEDSSTSINEITPEMPTEDIEALGN